jgi:Rap1a immunity proteins
MRNQLMRKVLLATVITSCFVSPAVAALISGNELYKYCQKDATRAICLGYISGVADVTQLIATKAEEDEVSRSLAFCRPVGVTNGQLVDVVMTYLEETPEDRHLPALVVILAALRQPWPCPPGADDYYHSLPKR